MKRLKKLATVILLCSGIVLAGCSSSKNSVDSDEVIHLTMAVADNDATPYAKGAKKIAEEVKLATDGRVQINVLTGGTLGGERATIELAMLGSVDIATAANPVLTNWFPEMGILDQPFLFDNENQAHAAVDGEIGDLINKTTQRVGLRVIGYMESGFRNVFSKEPITSIEDFEGVKIRTMQNQYHMTAFESFGAMPTPMAAGEQFTALQQGAIDAIESAVSNNLTGGYYEVANNITYTNHAFVYILICMSDQAWEKIPEELHDPFMEGVRKGYEAQRGYLKEANEAATVELEKLGVTFYDIDNELLKNTYLETAKEKDYIFDPEWQAAIDEVIAENPTEEDQ